jgi:Tfp pilus assembly protein PilZ
MFSKSYNCIQGDGNMEREREFHRYEVNIPCWFEIEPVFEKPFQSRCRIINISQKGMLFEGKLHYEIGKHLGLQFCLPSFEDTIKAFSQIVWTKEIIPKKVHRIGVEFIDLKNANQQKFQLITEEIFERLSTAIISSGCIYVDNQLHLSEEEIQLFKQMKSLKKADKMKVAKYISSLLKNSD